MDRIQNLALRLAGVGFIGLASTQFLPLQSQGDTAGIPGVDYINGRTLAEIPDSELSRRQSETIVSYASRVAAAVHFSTYHCEPTDFSLTPIETVISAILERLGKKLFWKEVGLFQKTTLVCGFCHQRAIALSNILRANNVDAWALHLAARTGPLGHVLVRFEAEGHEYLVDPDFGTPAYRYDVSTELLRREIELLYADAGGNNTQLIFGLVSNKAGAEIYFAPQWIASITRDREIVFTGADVTALALAVFGLLLIGAPTALRIRSAKRERKAAIRESGE